MRLLVDVRTGGAASRARGPFRNEADPPSGSRHLSLIDLAQPLRARPLAAYALAAVMVVLQFAVSEPAAHTLQSFPFLLPLTAVTLVAFGASRGPAILTAVLSGLVALYYVLPPFHTFRLAWPTGYIGLAFYASLATLIIALMHRIIAAHGDLQASRASLQALNATLEHRVAERTAALVATRDELRHTNADLEGIVEARVGDLRVANEEIQRFAYIVSHDLRAPLVNVLGFTSELDAVRGDLAAFFADVAKAAPQLVTPDRRALIEQDLPEALGFIRTSTAKMDRLINAILKLSREGRRKLTAEDIDIAALVAAQADSLTQQLEAKDASVVVEGELPRLVSDRLAVEQIFGNLIENAVKYLSPARAGRIVVRGRREGKTSLYEIADNGRGIDARDFERIFELFRRSGEQNTQGEGIGLAYVRNLARRLGGDVSVRSVFGEGSTFTVTLPAALVGQGRPAAA